MTSPLVAADRCAAGPAVPCPLAGPALLDALAEEFPSVRAIRADVREHADGGFTA
ncbi:hypothetical protein HNP84_007548 [Thermocatellispora tengchongensis]|uniref:Uncharacterized protein n=1 Tax=Thermocatellispora tengchongensis TaxID=1073253 RepID=A0A840PP42_9ACTN|nr:hypothetical protein [Thermocatellispora tengchongensis]MBB5137795.1 hypothetical protein [Thermocatellispora tengchongensis]